MSDHFRELAYRIWGTCPGVPGEIAGEGLDGDDEWIDRDRERDDREGDESAAAEPPIKLPDPPDGEGGFTEPEIPKVGSRDAPGG
jgi:hypothetical protein